MSLLKGNVLYGQSGGPTAVINASAYGVIKEALLHRGIIDEVYGMHYGIQGALNDDLYRMSDQLMQDLEKLPATPGAAFGSIRYKLKNYKTDETDYVKLMTVFKKYNIRYFFYNGGNDSMDTCNKIDEYLRHVGYECKVIGVPKTIDNDLPITDHSPGFGSAAKYIANTMMEIVCDNISYPKSKVAIVEIMGRHAGWLTAASHVATHNGSGPDLIYLPEIPFDKEKFLEDVKRVYTEKKRCVVAVSEGIQDLDGKFIGLAAQTQDSFGHNQLGGVADQLAELIHKRLGFSTREIEFGLTQRCAAHMQSKVDLEEAIGVGTEAMKRALKGESGVMVCIRRDSNLPYKSSFFTHPLNEIANVEVKIPRHMINKEGNGLEDSFLNYVYPLIQGEVKPKYDQGVVGFCYLKLPKKYN